MWSAELKGEVVRYADLTLTFRIPNSAFRIRTPAAAPLARRFPRDQRKAPTARTAHSPACPTGAAGPRGTVPRRRAAPPEPRAGGRPPGDRRIGAPGPAAPRPSA